MGFRLILVNKTNRINVKNSNKILKDNKSYQYIPSFCHEQIWLVNVIIHHTNFESEIGGGFVGF